MTRRASAGAGLRCGAGAAGGSCAVTVRVTARSPPPHAATVPVAARSARAARARMHGSSQPERAGSSARIASGPMSVAVRPARADELGPVAAALRAAGLGANVGRLLEFPYGSASGEVLVAVNDTHVVGGGAVAGFGPTGWIGALGVIGSARRRGLGTALTEAAVDWLRGHGAQTAM